MHKKLLLSIILVLSQSTLANPLKNPSVRTLILGAIGSAAICAKEQSIDRSILVPLVGGTIGSAALSSIISALAKNLPFRYLRRKCDRKEAESSCTLTGLSCKGANAKAHNDPDTAFTKSLHMTYDHRRNIGTIAGIAALLSCYYYYYCK